MRFFRAWSLSWVFCCGLTLAGQVVAEPVTTTPVTDLRVLVDVSGSMKQNDPHNLRAPALRLLVDLLPEGARSGVWTFGRYVNMQVPLGTVTPVWKRRALAEANRIHSRGQFTNIGEALERGTAGWSKPDPRYRRHVVLLTDGMVDIGKSAAKNRTETQRILKQLLPRLKQAGVHIHTVALSPNADRRLLRTLALETDGGFEQVDSASELERVFLRLFEKAVPVEALPLKNNRFMVDAKVADMTVLAFRQPGKKRVRLIAPDGSTYGDGYTAPGMIWRHEDGYDMITVNKPAPGEWTLEAALDPDNRVMVATNLSLSVEPLPNHALLGQRLAVRARLLEDSKPLADQRLLGLTRFSVSLQGADGQTQNLTLNDAGKGGDTLAGDGVYSADVPLLGLGLQRVTVEARAPSFERAFHHSLVVHDTPLALDIAAPGPEHPASYRVRIVPELSLVALKGLQLSVEVAGKQYQPERMVNVEPVTWGMELPASLVGQQFKLTLQGMLNNGAPVDVSVERQLPAVAQPVTGAAPEHTPADKAGGEEHPTPEAETHADKSVEAKKTSHGLWATLLVLGANLVIAAMIAGVVWWRRRGKKGQGGEDGAGEGESGEAE